jgi:hypothetical protein
MKANELRIGNWVLSKNMPVEIEEISIKTVTYCFGTFTLDYIKPMPLTEEWLLKFGFNTQIDTRFDKGYIWAIDTIEFIYLLRKSKIDNHYNLFRLDNFTQREYPIKYVIKYVHELQNLYFCLTTGEELPVKL